MVEHGFEGDDAEMFVCGSVDQEMGGAEERGFEGVGDGKQKEDLGARGHG